MLAAIADSAHVFSLCRHVADTAITPSECKIALRPMESCMELDMMHVARVARSSFPFILMVAFGQEV